LIRLDARFGQRLALHDRGQLPGDGDAVVAARQRSLDRADLLGGEAVGVLLAGVDDDLQVGDSGGAGGRRGDVRACLLTGAR
jgi:hypothetical protein